MAASLRRCLLLLLMFVVQLECSSQADLLPLVINTWPFTNATSAAWNTLVNKKGSIYDALVAGCSECEVQRCDGSVGPGGSPDEDGESTLDAMIMNGQTYDVGAVGCLRRIPSAIAVARAVMDYTEQTLLVGELATKFAVEMGFKEMNLSSPISVKMWNDWKANNCQPNYRINVSPDPTKNCGPYTPIPSPDHKEKFSNRRDKNIGPFNHDTIGMVVIDQHGNITAGTTTNGLKYKIPGRVGDSPIMGAGAYAVNGVGGAVATGDGDIMMRFLPSFHAVMEMESGGDPGAITKRLIQKIAQFYPKFTGALIAVTSQGKYGAACYGFPVFPYSVVNPALQTVTLEHVNCLV